MGGRTVLVALLLLCLADEAKAERPAGAGGGGGTVIWLEDMVWPGMGEKAERSGSEASGSSWRPGHGDRGGDHGGDHGGDRGAGGPGAAAGQAPQDGDAGPEKPWKRRREGAPGEGGAAPAQGAAGSAQGGEAPAAAPAGERPQMRRPEGMGHVYILRAGSFPERPDGPGFLKDAALWVTTPDGVTKRAEAQPMGRRGPALSVSTVGGGFYHVMAYADGGVKNGAHLHLFSRTSFMSHGDHMAPAQAPAAEGPGLFQGKPILNVEQLDLHEGEMRAATGQTLHLRVSFKDQPLANKEVALITRRNWRQSRRTNDQGEARFTLIKEDFPEAGERRKPSTYLVTVDHAEDATGEANGQPFTSEHYVATLSLAVYPSRWEWESQGLAYMVIVGSVIVSGGAIAIRRRRRRKTK